MIRNPAPVAAAALALALALAGCAATTDGATPASAPGPWSYEGATGPAAWGELSEDYAVCRTGREGSPVDLRGAIPARLGALDLGWRPVWGDIVDTGQGIQVNVADAGGFALGGHRYEMLQFHVHTPAEHLLHGRRFPLEVHFVHRRDDGLLGVIGVFIEEGAANPVLGSVLDRIGGRTAAPIDLTRLLPRDRDFYRYAGSLTTPPCSETVDWVVMEEPISASRAQIAAFARHYADNARPVQPLHRRFILHGED